MSRGIRISPKHGLNPCIPVCAFCGKEKNEIALLGRLKGDAEAPHNAIIDYVPCEECQANWSMGVALICTSTSPQTEGQPPLTEREGVGIYPAGKYTVMTPDAVKRIFGLEMETGQPVFVDEGPYNKLMEDAKAAGILSEDGSIKK